MIFENTGDTLLVYLAMVAVMGVVFYVWGVRAGWRTPALDQATTD